MTQRFFLTDTYSYRFTWIYFLINRNRVVFYSTHTRVVLLHGGNYITSIEGRQPENQSSRWLLAMNSASSLFLNNLVH